MTRSPIRALALVLVAALAASACAKKKPPTVDTAGSASDLGGFGPGSGAGATPGGAGGLVNVPGGVAGGVPGQPLPGGVGAGGQQLFVDANGNLVDANGNPVDQFGNPLGGVGGVAGGAGQLDQFGNPIGGAQQYDQFGNPIGAGQGGLYGQPGAGGGFAQAGQGAGSYSFAGDDGSPNYFAQRVGDRVLFDTDSSTLDAESQEILRRQAAWLQRHPQVAVTIEGHADERGTREYNLALGARRANAASRFLASQGVEPARIRTVSFGKERPVVPNSTPSAWRQNRRAVTTLRGATGAGF